MPTGPDADRFEPQPDLRERLAASPDLTASQVVDLACADMIERWRAGERIPAEAYVTLHPALQSDEDIFDLVYMEWVLRNEIGDPATAAEFLWRFPRQRARILAQASLDQFIDETRVNEHAVPDAAPREMPVPSEDEKTVVSRQAPSGYEIEAELGRGGMGVVYRARQARLKRVVALKMILADSHPSSEMISRFLAEAEMIARLKHPGIVQIHAVGEHEGLPFLELEYLSGGTLAARLDGTPWPAGQSARLVESVARGIEEAHRVGVIHRDLKPANILMSEDATPKVADFGIAKWLGGDSGLTHSRTILGSPSYMAPEQADGRNHEVGPASDVYALGAIFYELLTGRPPFRAPSLLLTLEQVKQADPVPPSRLQPGLSRDAETICLKCLEKSPARRYPSADALAEDLRRFSAREPILARPAPLWEKAGRWCQRSPAIAALSVALLLTTAGGFAGIVFKWRDAEVQRRDALRYGLLAKVSEAEAKRTLNASQQLSAELVLDRGLLRARRGDVAQGLILMMEGLKMAPAEARGFHELIRRNLTGWRERLHRLKRIHEYHSEVVSVAFSPDGTVYAAGCGDGTARLHDTATGALLWQSPSFQRTVDCLAFRPDGEAILIGGASTARLFETRTGRPIGRPMTHPGSVLRGSFRPDGKTLVTTYYGPTALLWDADTGEPTGQALTLDRSDRVIFCARFSPDGKSIFAGLKHPEGWMLPSEVGVWSAEGGRPTGPSFPHPAGVTVVDFAPDGQTLLTAGADGRVRLFGANRVKRILEFAADPQLVEPATFSPDGLRIVTAGPGESQARWWSPADGRPLGSPLKHQSTVWGLAFSPDGRSILTGSADKTARLWEVARDFAPPLADEPNSEPELNPTAADIVKIALFSPDGTRSLTVGRDNAPILRDTVSREVLSASNPDGPREVFAAAFSPDGRQVALAVATGPNSHSVEIRNDRWRRVGSLPQETFVDALTFSPDGTRLAVVDHRNLVQVWDLAGKKTVGTPLKADSTIHNLAFRPDGGSFAVSTSNGPVAIHWDFRAGKPIGRPLPKSLGTSRVGFSPDGLRLLTTTAQTARLWTAATGEPFGRPIPLSERSIDALFSPGGQVILTRCGDGEVCLWDPVRGEPVVPRMRHQAPATAVAIDATSRFVVAGYGDGSAQLWDVARNADTRATGRPIGPPVRHGARVLALTFLPGHGGFATIAANGETRIQPILEPIRGERELLNLRLEVETGHRVDVEKAAVPVLPELWNEYRRKLDRHERTRSSKTSP